MDFSFCFDTAVWASLATLAVSSIIALWARFKPVWAAGSAVRKQDPEGPRADATAGLPKVSVIVYTTTDEDDIYTYLEMAMRQDYPDYETIIVNEGGAEATSDLAERLHNRYPDRLYVTFIPPEAHNLSRRKLAQTIGIKAAKGDIVVTTASNCKIPSEKWISSLAAPFIEDPATDVVLGYSHIDPSDLHGAGKWYREMDSTLTACQWIGAAAYGRPYRGDGMNLAFRKDLFFHHKGYARTMHLVNGDDDIFLNEIMTPGNTSLSISPGSILASQWGVSGNRIHADLKERYQFTSRFLPRAPFLRAGLASAMQWAMPAAALAAGIAGLPSLLPACTALLLLTVAWTLEAAIYRRTARRLESTSLWWSLPWLLLWHPAGNCLFKMRRRRHLRKNYTFV